MDEKTKILLEKVQDHLMETRASWEDLQGVFNKNEALFKYCQSKMDQLDDECEQIRAVFLMYARCV